jgi:tRNA(Ser,Leu) C12 N-acetylase TAN1
MLKDTNEAGKEVTVSTGKQVVKLVADKALQGKDQNTGKPVEMVRYLVEHKGERKTYDTRKFNKDTGELSYLVQKLAEFEEGTTVVMEAKKIGTRNYISVKLATGVGGSDTLNDDDEEESEEVDDEAEAKKLI